MVIDHDTPAGSVAVAEKQKALLDWARQTGAVFRSGRGIGYALLLESGAGGRDRPLPAEPCRGGGSRPARWPVPASGGAGRRAGERQNLLSGPAPRLAVTAPPLSYLSVRDLAWTLIRGGQCGEKPWSSGRH